MKNVYVRWIDEDNKYGCNEFDNAKDAKGYAQFLVEFYDIPGNNIEIYDSANDDFLGIWD